MKFINLKEDLSSVVIPLIILILISEFSLIAVTISNQNYNQKQREISRTTTFTVLQESLATKCLLLVPTAQRGEETIDRCNEEAKVKVEAMR